MIVVLDAKIIARVKIVAAVKRCMICGKSIFLLLLSSVSILPVFEDEYKR
jgi:hypothetical protein